MKIELRTNILVFQFYKLVQIYFNYIYLNLKEIEQKEKEEKEEEEGEEDETVEQLRIWLFEYLTAFLEDTGRPRLFSFCRGGFLFRSLAALRDFFGSQEDSLS